MTRAGVERAAWLCLTVIGVALLVLIVALGFQRDVWDYWSADLTAPYATAARSLAGDAFRYAPPTLLVPALARMVPFDAFRLIWLLTSLLALRLLLGRWWIAAVACYPVALELSYGNIHLLLALALVAGFRWPAAWSALLLTKVTPAVVLLWLVVRGEWRALLAMIGCAAAIAAPTVVLVPQLWRQWIEMLAADAALPPSSVVAVPLVFRVVVAAALVVWAARTDRRWAVPIAATIALPTLWIAGLSMLAAVPALAANPGSVRRTDSTAAKAPASRALWRDWYRNVNRRRARGTRAGRAS